MVEGSMLPVPTATKAPTCTIERARHHARHHRLVVSCQA